MKRLFILLVAMVLVFGANAAQFSKSQKAEIQNIVRDYLVKPTNSSTNERRVTTKQYQMMQTKALQAIKKHQTLLFKPDQTQVAGNPKGKVTLIEFLIIVYIVQMFISKK